MRPEDSPKRPVERVWADLFTGQEYWSSRSPLSEKSNMDLWSPDDWGLMPPEIKMLWTLAQGYQNARNRWVETCLWEDGDNTALSYLQQHFRVWGVVLEFRDLRVFLEPNGCIHWALVRALTSSREAFLQETGHDAHA
jgi:hypothetical protein